MKAKPKGDLYTERIALLLNIAETARLRIEKERIEKDADLSTTERAKEVESLNASLKEAEKDAEEQRRIVLKVRRQGTGISC